MHRPARPRKLLLLILMLSLTACPAENPPRGAVDLSVDGQVINAWIDVGGYQQFELHESVDGGHTWVEVESPDSLPSRPETDTTACLAQGPCFRTDGSGDTAVWQVGPNGAESPAWSFPPGRLQFLERYAVDDFVGAYDPVPHDIVVLNDVVLVAMGNDGVLRRAPDGSWERGVLGVPEPFAQWGANVEGEIWLILMATALLMAVVMLVSFTRFATAMGWVRGWRLLGPWVAFGYLATLPALFVAFNLAAVSGGNLQPALLLIPTFAAAGTTWSRMFPDGFRRSGTWSRMLLFGIPGAGVLAFVPFFLWSGGAFDRYEVAPPWSLAVGVGGLITTIVAIFRVQASGPPDMSFAPPIDTPPAATREHVPWEGGVVVSTGTLFFSIVFLLPYHVLEDPFESTLARLSVGLLGLGAALLLVERRTRAGARGQYAFSGLAASLLGGPGVGAMFVMPSPGRWGTANRILLYLIYWVLGGTLLGLGASVARTPGVGTLIFGVLLTLSPLCIPAADWWSLGESSGNGSNRRRPRRPPG